nr:MAG TPA: protein of unknown function (DUF4352) [Caudoviricetes sp.]
MKKLAVLLMVVLLLSGCTSQKAASSEKQPASSAAQSSESKAEPEESVPEESEPEPESGYLEMGTDSVLGDWGINVKSMEIVDSIPNGEYLSFVPEEGNSYLVIAMSATNNGKKAGTFLPSYSIGNQVSSKLLYGDGYEFSATNLLGYDQELHDAYLNPLSSKEGVIAFEVPQAVSSSDDQILLRLKGEGKEIIYKIR